MASLRALVLGASVFMCQSLPGQAETGSVVYGEAAGWRIEALSFDGQFLRCAARPAGAAALEVQLSSEGPTLVLGGVDAPDGPGRIDIDRASFEGSWYRGDTGMIWFLDEGQLTALRQGRAVTATAAGQAPVTLALDGVAQALEKLEACLNDGGQSDGAALAEPAPETGIAMEPGADSPGVILWPGTVPPQPMEDDTQRLGANCPQWGQYASGPSETVVKAQFVNEADRAVGVYWIGFDGMLTEYAGLLPGETFEVDTYEGHVWVAKDQDGTCLNNGALFPRAGKLNTFALR